MKLALLKSSARAAQSTMMLVFVLWADVSPGAALTPITKSELKAALVAWDANTCAPCATTYGAVGTWHVTAVTDFSSLLIDLINFNEDLTGWDPGAVNLPARVATCRTNQVFVFATAAAGGAVGVDPLDRVGYRRGCRRCCYLYLLLV